MKDICLYFKIYVIYNEKAKVSQQRLLSVPKWFSTELSAGFKPKTVILKLKARGIISVDVEKIEYGLDEKTLPSSSTSKSCNSIYQNVCIK